MLPIFVVGTVVLEIATETESAGLGVFYAIATGYIITRKLTFDKFINALRYSILTSAKIMIIIAFSKLGPDNTTIYSLNDKSCKICSDLTIVMKKVVLRF